MPTDPPPPKPPPPEPPEPEGPFRLLDWKFWMAVGFVVLCLVAAAVVVLFGPKIWPKAAPHPAPPAVSAPLRA